MNSSDRSLVVVGSGIKLLSHLTTEAIAYIKQSDKVLFSLNEPILEEWIKKNNPHAQSFDFLKDKYHLRSELYQAITNFIIQEVKKPQHVCVIFYGHPVVFAQPALNAALKTKEEGYFTKILPGISAEDCLFADLMIDPGSHGCLSYEATDFLIRQKNVYPGCHLILWQVGMIGALGAIKNHDNTNGKIVLLDYLSKFYTDDKQIILYEAALYPHLEPKIKKFLLKEMININFSSLSTLYIPPAYQTQIDPNKLQELKINIADLTRG